MTRQVPTSIVAHDFTLFPFLDSSIESIWKLRLLDISCNFSIRGILCPFCRGRPRGRTFEGKHGRYIPSILCRHKQLHNAAEGWLELSCKIRRRRTFFASRIERRFPTPHSSPLYYESRFTRVPYGFVGCHEFIYFERLSVQSRRLLDGLHFSPSLAKSLFTSPQHSLEHFTINSLNVPSALNPLNLRNFPDNKTRKHFLEFHTCLFVHRSCPHPLFL